MDPLDRIIEIQSSLLKLQRHVLRVTGEVDQLFRNMERAVELAAADFPPRPLNPQREFQRSVVMANRQRAARRVADEAIVAGAFTPEGTMTIGASAESEKDDRRLSRRAMGVMWGHSHHEGLSRGELGQRASEYDEDSEAGSRRSRTSDEVADDGSSRSGAPRAEGDSVRRSKRTKRSEKR